MTCPIVLTNNTLNSVVVLELSEITLESGLSARIDELFTLETISNSSELQALITSGDVSLTYGPDLITDLADLCVLPSELNELRKLSWSWSAGRKGSVDVSAIDLVSLDNAGTNDLPFITPSDCIILKAVAKGLGELIPGPRGLVNSPWKFQILKSTDSGDTWTVEREEEVTEKVFVYDYLSVNLGLPLNSGNCLRLRFVKTEGFIINPQVTLLIKEL